VERKFDPAKHAALFRRHDMVMENVMVIPVITRPAVAAMENDLHVPANGWDLNTGAIHDWWRDA